MLTKIRTLQLLALLLFGISGASMERLADAQVPDKKPEKAAGNEQGKPEQAKPARKPIKAGTATIKGKIVFAEDAPAFNKSEDIARNFDCSMCVLPEAKMFMHADQTWIIGKDKGVANVLIRLKVPADSYFKPSDADMNRAKEKVVIDQPCCAFEPHVVALFPSYFDGTKLMPTGQVLQAKNSAKFLHNVKILGDERKGNGLPSKSLAPGGSVEFKLAPEDGPIEVVCDAHPWMKAKLFAYDHPYAVVTGMDGTFEMKNVPIGTKLSVEFWHEAKGVFKTVEVTLAEKQISDQGAVTISK